MRPSLILLFLMLVLCYSQFLTSEARYIYTLAGDGTAGDSGDGGSATQASLNYPWGVSVSFDGAVYIADYANSRVRVVYPNGIIQNFAGNGIGGYSGDGGLAVEAELFNPTGTAVSNTNEVYIADFNNNVIRKVYKNGTITTFAGNGIAGGSGDGGPATSAELFYPFSVTVSSDQKVFIDDYYNSRIRVVINGTINTYAGNGGHGYYGEGVIATAAYLYWPQGVSLGPTGDLYIADTSNHRVRIVYTNQTIYLFAGNGFRNYSGDGGPAVDAGLSAWAVAASPTGEVYIVDGYNNRIRVVFNNGTIDTVAGNGQRAYSGEGGPSNDASLFFPIGVAVGPNGDIYIADAQAQRVRRVSCNPGETGFNCQLFMCYGLNLTSPNICSGNGTCIGPDTRNCTTGSTGNNCQYEVKDSIAFRFKMNSLFLLLLFSFLII
jgi:hypothetical protein